MGICGLIIVTRDTILSLTQVFKNAITLEFPVASTVCFLLTLRLKQN